MKRYKVLCYVPWFSSSQETFEVTVCVLMEILASCKWNSSQQQENQLMGEKANCQSFLVEKKRWYWKRVNWREFHFSFQKTWHLQKPSSLSHAPFLQEFHHRHTCFHCRGWQTELYQGSLHLVQMLTMAWRRKRQKSTYEVCILFAEKCIYCLVKSLHLSLSLFLWDLVYVPQTNLVTTCKPHLDYPIKIGWSRF